MRKAIINLFGIGLSVFSVLTTPAFAGEKEERVMLECAGQTGGNPVGWARCVGRDLVKQEVQNFFKGKAFGCRHEVRKLLDRSCRRKIIAPPKLIFSMPYRNGYILGYESGGHSLYYSPDGKNLRGGGNTKLVYRAGQRVRAIAPYRGGVITAFSQGGIYFSPNGFNLGGGGVTKKVYPKKQRVKSMRVIYGRVETCFDSKCYCSPDENNLGGGGNTRGGRC